MNKITLFLIMLIPFYAKSQTYKSYVEKDEIEYTYDIDSTKNIEYFFDVEDMKKYIGQKVIFLERSDAQLDIDTNIVYDNVYISHYIPEEDKEIYNDSIRKARKRAKRKAVWGALVGTQNYYNGMTEYNELGERFKHAHPNNVEGKTFTIIDVTKENYRTFLILLSSNRDTIKVENERNMPLILTAYIDKMKDIHIDSIMYAFNNHNGIEPINLTNIQKTVKLYNSDGYIPFKCIDFGFVDFGMCYKLPCLILENDNGEKIPISLMDKYPLSHYFPSNNDKIEHDDYPYNILTIGSFVNKNEYYNSPFMVSKREQDIADSIAKAELAEIKLKIKKREKERIDKINSHKGEWSDEIIRVLLEKKVRIGMTSEMCRLGWGKPNKINRTTTTYCVREQWVYGNGNYLYFEDGVLTAIQN